MLRNEYITRCRERIVDAYYVIHFMLVGILIVVGKLDSERGHVCWNDMLQNKIKVTSTTQLHICRTTIVGVVN